MTARCYRIIATSLVIAVSLPTTAVAQTSYPMLMSLKPAAAQVGTSSVHALSSRYSMAGAYKVLVSGDGVTGEIVKDKQDAGKRKRGRRGGRRGRRSTGRTRIKFTVAPDAKPGVRDFRIATPNGASTLGQLVIVRDPVVVESGTNNTPEQANPVKLPATFCGAIERAEDVDYFKFHAKAGQSFTFHVRAMRLQDRIHDLQQHVDPIISIRNASGSTIVQSDNYYAADPLLTHRFDEDGDYFLEIRDVRYQGNNFWEYCIEASDRPFVVAVHPMGVARGKSTPLELIGRQLPQNRRTDFQGRRSRIRENSGVRKTDGRILTNSATVERTALEGRPTMALGPQTVQLKLPNGELTNPVAVVVSDLSQTVEADGENNTYKTAQPVQVRGGISGRIGKEADIDCFVFEAKKGRRYSFEVMARRWGSALDSHLRILDAKTGRQLALNDDLTANRRLFSDSQIEFWAPPADGKYVLEIRDVHLRGGDDFVYYVNCTRSEPTFELYLDTDKTLLTPGTSGAIFARAIRKNGFTGEIQLDVSGLPAGVSASKGKILAGRATDGCVILSAAPDAKMDVANITVTGIGTAKIAGKERELRVTAQPQQETYMPGGGRNHWHVDMHTVSIGAPNDLRAVKLSTYHVTLKPGESKRIEVTLNRAANFNSNVTLDVRFRHLSSMFADTLPKGVAIDGRNSRTLVTGKVSKGYITLRAAPNAQPAEKQQVSVMANISINFVMKATYSAKPLFVTVKK